MPRQKSLMTVIRDMVQQEVRTAIQSLLGSISTGKTKNRRRRHRNERGKWRRGGPGRPPKAVAEKAARKKKAVATPSKPKNGRRRRHRRGPGRPPGSKKKTAA